MKAVAKSDDPELEDKVAFVYSHPFHKNRGRRHEPARAA